MGEKYEYLKKVLDDSHYTVALCGSGILAETGAGLSKTRIMLMRLSRSTEDHRKIFSQVPIT